MEKVSKERLKLLKKLQKMNLYPDLQKRIEEDIDKSGVEGINADKNREKIRKNNPNVYESNSGKPMSKQVRQRVEETAAGAPAVVEAAFGPVTGMLYDKAQGTAKIAYDLTKAFAKYKARVKEVGPEEALKEFKQDLFEGKEATYKQLNTERPEDILYREQQREKLEPFLQRSRERLEQPFPSAYGSLENLFGALGFGGGQSGSNSGQRFNYSRAATNPSRESFSQLYPPDRARGLDYTNLREKIGKGLGSAGNAIGRGLNYAGEQFGNATDYANQKAHNGLSMGRSAMNQGYNYANQTAQNNLGFELSDILDYLNQTNR